MKVLWITNIALPQISADIGEESVPVGGWMVKLADELSAINNIKLFIMFPYSRLVNGAIGGIQYSSFVSNKTGTHNTIIEKKIREFGPDVVHIFGTECYHSYAVARICQKLNLVDRLVVSIQGLVSVYSGHYTAYLPRRVVTGYTIRDFIKGNIKKNQAQFAMLGRYEIQTLKMVKHIIGRTDWDKAATGFINPNRNYYFNNEMLREEFYTKYWDISQCERYSIFFSQATSPLKGLHLMLEAVELLKENFPDIRLYIAGKSYSQKKKYKLSYYERYILKKIIQGGLTENVIFTGFLDETQMCQRYLRSHVFASASSIENSPNSVCEAMILGVPIVASMVGGVANLMEHGKEGFYYPADEPYMLAYYIKQIFDNDQLAKSFSVNARKKALERHEPNKIVTDLLKIYEGITLKRK